MTSRSELAPTLSNDTLSSAKQKRNHKSGIALVRPVSLVESEISPFSPTKQILLFSEDPRNGPQIDEPELRRKEAQRAVSYCPESTRLAYESDLKSFHRFCSETGRLPCPATAETITLYLGWQAGRGLAAATISRRLSAISREHQAKGHPTPCDRPEVRKVLRDVRRELGTAPKPKLPIWPDDLKAMLEACGDGPRALRDRALMLTGFASGMRRGELVALDLADVTSEALGLRIRILRSKTDQCAAGADVGVFRGKHRATCPVRALQAWIAKRGRQPGPLFSPVLRSGKITTKRLSGAAVARIVKQAVSRVGLDPAMYAGHSMRSGCATSASAAGADIKVIQARLRHANIVTTARYIRYGSVFANDPLRGVL